MKKFKWTFQVTIETVEMWVEDGFNPSADQIEQALDERLLGYAYGNEKRIKAKLISKPNQKLVASVQGFKTVKEMNRTP